MENADVYWPIAVLAGLMGLIHVYVFFLESIWWSRPRTAKLFRESPEKMEAGKLLAFNQGFYNLFLAIALFLGLFLQFNGNGLQGKTLCDYAAGSIFMAGAVLLYSSPKAARPALVQMLPALAYGLCRWIL